MYTRLRIIGRLIVTPQMIPGVTEFLPDEKFTSLVFYDGYIIPWYYISNYGRIYSVRYDRLIKPYLDQGGYYRVSITLRSGEVCFTGVHKLTLMSFDPIIETDLYVPNHKDGNKTNNYIGNLEWATISENTRHALDTGLANCKCENNSRSILTNEQVHFICSLMEQGYSNSMILNKLGLAYGPERNKIAAVVRLIRRGQTYLDIAKQYNIPGINGRVTYPLEFASEVCEILIDDSRVYTIEDICNVLDIPLEDRKMFNNYIDDLIKGNTATSVTRNLPKPMIRPKTLSRSHPMYKWYY